jgi:hypothetical protein
LCASLAGVEARKYYFLLLKNELDPVHVSYLVESPQRRVSGEERIHLIPEIAPDPDNPPALRCVEELSLGRNYTAKAASAVGWRQVRRVLEY